MGEDDRSGTEPTKAEKAAARKAAAEETAGHRGRLRAQLLELGPDALLDHEVLEFLLTLSDRRGDTKGKARALLAEFGSIGAVLNADVEALRKADLGDPAIGAIKIARASALRLLQSEVANKPILAAWSALLDYLRADMAHLQTERVRVIYLDAKNALMRDEIVSEGSVDQAAVYVREIVRRALVLQCSAIVLVHNHPSGDPAPSRADIQLTRDIVQAMKPLNIAVHDHVVIGLGGHASMRSLGLI